MTLTVSHRKTRGGFWLEPTTEHSITWPAHYPIPSIGDRLDWPLDDHGALKGRVIGRTFTEAGVLLFTEEAIA